VLEHVPDFQRGLAELARCLAPGGWLLLSTPMFLHYDRTQVRAVLGSDGVVEHLRDPEFHGDPLSADGVLCFYHFGWSLLDDLMAFGFCNPKIVLFWSRRYGHLGGLQPIILAQKPPGPITAASAAAPRRGRSSCARPASSLGNRLTKLSNRLTNWIQRAGAR
jgi:hypothetical protein